MTLLTEGFIPLYIGILVILFFLSSLFSGSETALVSSRERILHERVKQGKKSAKRAKELMGNTEWFLSVILVGNNIANIVSASFFAYLAKHYFLVSDQYLFILTIIQAVAFLIVCEVLPKVLARGYPEQFLMVVSFPLQAASKVLSPVVNGVNLFTGFFKRSIHFTDDSSNVKSRDEIELLFRAGEEVGTIDDDHRLFVSEILSFTNLTARDIMTPTVEMVAVSSSDSFKKIVTTFSSSGFSRLPVYESRVDIIKGYLFYRHFFKSPGKSSDVSRYIIQPVFVPATKKVDQLFSLMQERNLILVFVVDEYGGVIGMVTQEDIAEEIVGEIQTKDHTDNQLIEQVTTRKYILHGSLSIEYLKRIFGINIEKKQFETIAGFIMSRTGSIALPGEKVDVRRASFTVLESDERMIHRVQMVLK